MLGERGPVLVPFSQLSNDQLSQMTSWKYHVVGSPEVMRPVPSPERAPALPTSQQTAPSLDEAKDREIARGDIKVLAKEIARRLAERSGKTWSVTNARGSSWGWLTIHAPPQRRAEYGYLSPEDQEELTHLLGLDHPVHHQGESIAASSAHRLEYLQRAGGVRPTAIAKPYWD